jgi:hypothetical protein
VVLEPPTGEELVDQFVTCQLSGEQFEHAQHLEVAWYYLRKWPLLETIKRFDRDLLRFATHHGDPGKYHRTITWAFLFLVHERAARLPDTHQFEEFRSDAADLFEKSKAVLGVYYRPESLADPLSKEIFVFPDAGCSLDRPVVP